MDKIKLRDIDIERFQRLNNQGLNSTCYTDGNICIKMIDDLYPEEKETLKIKLLEMDGINIDGVITPTGLILENDTLEGIISPYFKESKSFLTHFEQSRYISSKELLLALKKASLILRNLHNNNIIYQDINFANILIDNTGNIKYCDIDSCSYKGYESPYISVFLSNYMLYYRKEKNIEISKNNDRLSLLLAFFELIYRKELQKVSSRQYNSLSKQIKTLENCRKYVEILKNKGKNIPEIPYIDELIEDSDNEYIDRYKQLGIIRRILG